MTFFELRDQQLPSVKVCGKGGLKIELNSLYGWMPEAY